MSTAQERKLSMDTSFESVFIQNQFNQPVGLPIGDWKGAIHPRQSTQTRLSGQYVYLEFLNPTLHGDDLWNEFSTVPDTFYTYLFHGPFTQKEDFIAELHKMETGPNVFYTIFDNTTNKAIGKINLMRIDPSNGVIEIGCVCFGPKLAKTRMATEVIYLLQKHVFEDLNYLRLEWKCDSNNIPSRNAAQRFGFTFEGLFRKCVIYRGRCRDTTWFSMLRDEYDAIMNPAYIQYLQPTNFDDNKQHIKSLQSFIQPLRHRYDLKLQLTKSTFYLNEEQDVIEQSKNDVNNIIDIQNVIIAPKE